VQQQLEVDWQTARTLVLPALRQVVEPPQAWRVALADPEAALVRQRVLPMLHALVVLEHDEQRVFVDHRMARAWGVGPEQVMAAARSNLAARATEGLRPVIQYGLWQLATGDGLASSRLLLPGWLAGFAGTVPGRPVAIAPAPRVLLVGGDQAIGQIQRLVELGRDGFRTAAQGLSPVPYTVDDQERVVPWEGEGVLGAEAQASQRLLDVVCYAAQRDQLAGTVPGRVVGVKRVQHEGRSATLCTWAPHDDGVWLPVTDLVRLEEGGPVVPFAVVQKLARGALEPAGLEPPRFRARWPSSAVRDKLAAAAVPDPEAAASISEAGP
jgi:hypothetical protein